MEAASVKERVYIFDSSVFITLNTINRDSIHLPQEVWDKLDELMDEGKIVSHRYVYDEVVIAKSTKPDKVSQWLEPKKHHFPKENNEQVHLMAQVVQEFPKLIEIANEKEQADPWLVAMAVDRNNTETDKTFVLVTQEKQTKTTNLPAACRHFKVESIPLATFFHEVGVSFGISIAQPVESGVIAPAPVYSPETI